MSSVRIISYNITESITIKAFLKREGYSTNTVNKLKYKSENGILVNGASQFVIYRLSSGDVLTLNFPEDDKTAKPNTFFVPILYEDDDLIAYDKPAGMPVHPVKKHQNDTLAGVFAAHLQSMGRSAAFRPVGRLDMNTTGIVLAAKNAHAAYKLSDKIHKVYIAVCHDDNASPLPQSGIMDTSMRATPDSRIKQETSEQGAPALTVYKKLAERNGRAIAAVLPVTGRTHQIRLHFAAAGTPLVGDTLYGQPDGLIGRQALHCAYMDLTHPLTKQHIPIFAPPDRDMKALIEALDMPELSDEKIKEAATCLISENLK